MLSLKHPLGSHVPNGDYHRESPCTFGARLAIPHTEQDWKLHKDLFQDACVKHNEVDADNDSITSMHTPLSKSSAEGNNDQDHDGCNCNSLLDYCECWLFCLSPLQLLMNYMTLLINICFAEISTLNVLLQS